MLDAYAVDTVSNNAAYRVSLRVGRATAAEWSSAYCFPARIDPPVSRFTGERLLTGETEPWLLDGWMDGWM